MKTYPTSPYYDDYDSTKQFYRILFRPGRAVQARELTQIQTIIQAQIERIGNGIYKDGSFVTPPKETYDPNYNYVKLQTSYNSVTANSVLATLVGQIIIGQTSGVRAKVVNYVLSENSDPPTLYIKYLNSGTNGTTNTFANDEVITNAASTISVRSLASSATGSGTSYSIGESVVFAKGSFVVVDQQTLIVEKYGPVTSVIIGFTITETVLTSENDQSLLDPAVGSFNYFAPGADRYSIDLALDTRPFVPVVTDDPNFIEIVRIEDGIIISNFLDPRLSVIGDTLAKRTFDESGNYVVRPFKVDLIEHLRTSNAQVRLGVLRDGLLTSTEGGNADLYVNVISPGKAYVKGYEVENISTRYLTSTKARDFTAVNSGVVATQLSSYINVDNVYSIPSLTNIPTATLHSSYNATPGTSNGTQVGTAKIRGIEYTSGNVMDRTASFQVSLFDVVMDPGYTFEKDAKQIFSDNTGFADFTANISPTLVSLTGSASYTNTSNAIVGAGTRFTTELVVNDVITINNQRFTVSSISNDVSLTATNNAVGNASGQLFFLNTSRINDPDKDTFIIEFPYDVIKSVDPTNVETTYTTKRLYSRTLSTGSITITAGVDETFAPFSSDNYQAIITSGGRAGEYVTLTSGKVSRGGSPTGTTVTFNLSGDGLVSETVQLYTTVNKTNSAAIRKTKTLVANANVDFISRSDAQATSISLSKADGYKLKSVKMSNVAFGASFVDAGSVDITSRYTFNNGQKDTYYDLASITLKPGQAKPTNPIRVTFDYFTHGSGDYFSVNSYSGINYKDVPEITIGTKTYKLRDCLDFRPRINDAGTGFTSTGASATEFIDPEVDFQTDYQYYLPRIDKVVIDKNSRLYSVEGISSLNPKEPSTPDDALALFVVKQNPYVFDVVNDIEITEIDNKRFTMRDIGKIENRVKNLEYYTTLNFLERDAQQTQIKDSLGFERFKNGFLVDSFTGHGVGDSVDNPDYSVSINYSKREASPLVSSKFVDLKETALNNTARTGNNYVLTGDIITLPYTEEVFIDNKVSSTTENLNPFNVVVFNGIIKLDPPGDLWFDDQRRPVITVDRTGQFESLSSASLIKKDGTNVFGSINDIEQFRNGIPQENSTIPDNLKSLADLIGSVSASTTSLELSGNEVIINTSVIPKMRDVSINISAEGMRPNTRVYVFFDGINVTNYCRPQAVSTVSSTDLANVSANVSAAVAETVANPVIITDQFGSANIVFGYVSSILDFSTGRKTVRLSNNPNGDTALEDTFAEAVFFSDGVLRDIASEQLRPSAPAPESIPWYDSGNTGITPITPTYEQPPNIDGLEAIYQFAFGRSVDPSGREYWTGVAQAAGIDLSSTADMTSAAGQVFAETIGWAGAYNITESGRAETNGYIGLLSGFYESFYQSDPASFPQFATAEGIAAAVANDGAVGSYIASGDWIPAP